MADIIERLDHMRENADVGEYGEEVLYRAKQEIERLSAEVHKLTGRLIHAENTLGVIAQDGTDYPVRYANEYFAEVNRGSS